MSDSSHSDWQAAVGATWGASQRRGAEGAYLTRERATSVVEVAQPGFTGLSFHTFRYIDGPACPPFSTFMLLAPSCSFPVGDQCSFLIWYWYDKRSAAARLRDLRDQQCDFAPAEGAASTEVSNTFPPEVWI